MRRLLSVPVVLAALSGVALVGGCGDSTADDQAGDGSTTTPSASASVSVPSASGSPPTASISPTPTTAPLPACDAVWVDGQTLAFSYHGCVDGERTVKAQKQPCEMGKPLVTYANRFWAAAGGPIHEVPTILAKDSSWHRALIQCGG